MTSSTEALSSPVPLFLDVENPMSRIDHDLKVVLGELVLLKHAAEKQAGPLGAIGKGVDWAVGKGVKALAPGARLAGRQATKTPGKLWDIGMEAGGIRGVTKEKKLLDIIKRHPSLHTDVQALMAHGQARGIKNPVTAGGLLFSPMKTLTGRNTEAGQTRWLLNALGDPRKAQEFLHGAPPATQEAFKRVMASRVPGMARSANELSFLGQAAPAAIIGGPVAYNLAKGTPEDERPVISSPTSGFAFRSPKDPNMLENFWGSVGDKARGISPGLGDAIADHPYVSTAATAGLAGAGLYGLLRGHGDQQ